MHSIRYINLTRTLAAASYVVGIPYAHAQSASLEDPSPKAQVTIGVGAAFIPRYEGAADNRTQALPLVNYRNGRFFAGGLRGIGYDLSPTPTVSFGPVLSWRFGCDQDDADRLQGLGDIDGGLDAGAFVRWNLRPVVLHASLKSGITGDGKGAQLRFGAAYTTRLSPTDSLTIDAAADWADSNVMQTNFGVNAEQSSRSGLRAYDANAGIRRYGVSLIWVRSFWKQWFTTVGATVYRLGNEATNSPIVERGTLSGANVGIGYRF